MEVVSEKTGYPVETLELSMDMKSRSHGMDSHQAGRDPGRHASPLPDLPKLKPEELAELRTLGQIVEHIGAKLGTHSVSTTSVIIPAGMAPAAPAVSSAPVAVATPGVDLSALTQSLMEVVSEKTGYPVETLELPSMDVNPTSASTPSSELRSWVPCSPFFPTCPNSNRRNWPNCVPLVR